ncbi:heme-binding protein [Leucobacter luti]|uniref:heme-binding protein n=1 Tax=Leucobacter luti TaxID=340320 RepID=UPI003D703E00
MSNCTVSKPRRQVSVPLRVHAASSSTYLRWSTNAAGQAVLRWRSQCPSPALPLSRDGKVVGAVGVSGGSGEQDHSVAEAGAAAL